MKLKFNIKEKIFFSVFLSSLFTFLILALVLILHFDKIVKNELENKYINLVKDSKKNLDYYIRSIINISHGISQNNNLKLFLEEPSSKENALHLRLALNDFLAKITNINEISVFDLDGNCIISTISVLEGKITLSKESINYIREKMHYQISHIVISKINKESLLIILNPIFNDLGKLIGFIEIVSPYNYYKNHLGIDSLQSKEFQFIFDEEGSVAIFDKEGLTNLNQIPWAEEIMSNKEYNRAKVVKTIDKKKYAIYFEKLKDVNIYNAIIVSDNNDWDIIKPVILNSILTIAVLLCIMSLVSYLLSHSFSSKIDGLKTFLKELQSGNIYFNKIKIDNVFKSDDEFREVFLIIVQIQDILYDVFYSVNSLNSMLNNSINFLNITSYDIRNQISSEKEEVEKLDFISKNIYQKNNENLVFSKTNNELTKNLILNIKLSGEEVFKTKVNILKVKEELEIIKQIASDINLLGLNASIEAIRAGDSGLGFVLVANQVKDLSDSSSQTSEKIINFVNKVVDVSVNSSKLLEDILHKIGSVENYFQYIISVFTEQKSDLVSIDLGISNIKKNVDVNTDHVTKINTTIVNLSKELDDLRKKMEYFEL